MFPLSALPTSFPLPHDLLPSIHKSALSPESQQRFADKHPSMQGSSLLKWNGLQQGAVAGKTQRKRGRERGGVSQGEITDPWGRPSSQSVFFKVMGACKSHIAVLMSLAVEANQLIKRSASIRNFSVIISFISSINMSYVSNIVDKVTILIRHVLCRGYWQISAPGKCPIHTPNSSHEIASPSHSAYRLLLPQCSPPALPFIPHSSACLWASTKCPQ